MDNEITLKVLLDHMQGMRRELVSRIDRLEHGLNGRMDKLEGRMDKLENRVDRMHTNFMTQLDAIDKRLDTIEIAIVEQKHEERITALEKHDGLVKA